VWSPPAADWLTHLAGEAITNHERANGDTQSRDRRERSGGRRGDGTHVGLGKCTNGGDAENRDNCDFLHTVFLSFKQRPVMGKVALL